MMWRYRGVLHYAQGNLDAALQDLSQALQLDPTYANAFYLRAKINRDRGDLPAARQDAERALQLGYALPDGFWGTIEK